MCPSDDYGTILKIHDAYNAAYKAEMEEQKKNSIMKNHPYIKSDEIIKTLYEFRTDGFIMDSKEIYSCTSKGVIATYDGKKWSINLLSENDFSIPQFNEGIRLKELFNQKKFPYELYDINKVKEAIIVQHDKLEELLNML